MYLVGIEGMFVEYFKLILNKVVDKGSGCGEEMKVDWIGLGLEWGGGLG